MSDPDSFADLIALLFASGLAPDPGATTVAAGVAAARAARGALILGEQPFGWDIVPPPPTP